MSGRCAFCIYQLNTSPSSCKITLAYSISSERPLSFVCKHKTKKVLCSFLSHCSDPSIIKTSKETKHYLKHIHCEGIIHEHRFLVVSITQRNGGYLVGVLFERKKGKQYCNSTFCKNKLWKHNVNIIHRPQHTFGS